MTFKMAAPKQINKTRKSQTGFQYGGNVRRHYSQQDIFDSQQDIPQAQSVSVENFELISSDSSPYSTVSSIPTDPPSPVFRKRRRLARVDVTSSQASTIQPEDVTDSQTSDTVPSFPDWFNIMYDGDEAIYTYHHLDADVDKADMQILI
ncbi:uncharacterized protein LOC127849925 [Dreissena polymorpha]|uniref:uncharacterized protein LOC127849925 n=1 Tax=Dreissena polymorpha TaxID=45954 RepID=UPI0022644446|nr:uncharacterized protein LOC127849925 [Dreissena polymorpha]